MNKSKDYQVILDQIKNFRYFYLDLLPGAIKTLPHYGRQITQEAIEDAKEAFLDHFNDGCEMEWETEAQWKYWEAISVDWFNQPEYSIKKVKDFA